MQNPHDQSMEQALAAIKRVMAEEKDLRVASRVAAPEPEPEPAPAPAADVAEPQALDAGFVLELDETMVEELKLPAADLGPPLVSSDAAEASRLQLAELQHAAATAPPPPAVNPLEQVVRDMLRPALKDWLDQNLPAIVEEHVKREISRITGQRI
jgi:cell pole-organizing protein PopZ